MKSFKVFSPDRYNKLTKITNKIGMLQNLKELIVVGNELTLLPPTLAQIKDLEVMKLEDNPWIEPIEVNRVLSIHHMMEYLSGNAYSMIYARRSVRLR